MGFELSDLECSTSRATLARSRPAEAGRAAWCPRLGASRRERRVEPLGLRLACWSRERACKGEGHAHTWLASFVVPGADAERADAGAGRLGRLRRVGGLSAALPRPGGRLSARLPAHGRGGAGGGAITGLADSRARRDGGVSGPRRRVEPADRTSRGVRGSHSARGVGLGGAAALGGGVAGGGIDGGGPGGAGFGPALRGAVVAGELRALAACAAGPGGRGVVTFRVVGGLR